VGGAFLAHDQLRPAEVFTFAARAVTEVWNPVGAN